MAEPHLVLASASPRRRELLAALGLTFDVAATATDEEALLIGRPDEPPAQLAVRLATAKGEAAGAGADAVSLAADTVVFVDGRVLGKPGDAAEAAAMLRLLRGREHAVATGIAVRRAGELTTDVAVARVTMRWYGEGEIARYIARGEPFDKAGGYAIQDEEFAPVARLQGCRCAVVGLPLWRTARLLRSAGVPAADPTLPACLRCPDRPSQDM